MIKLIRNLKQGQNEEMVKGCTTQDVCNAVDSSSATCPVVDICVYIDTTNCFTQTDVCSYDYASCRVSIDACGTDNFTCGYSYDA